MPSKQNKALLEILDKEGRVAIMVRHGNIKRPVYLTKDVKLSLGTVNLGDVELGWKTHTEDPKVRPEVGIKVFFTMNAPYCNKMDTYHNDKFLFAFKKAALKQLGVNIRPYFRGKWCPNYSITRYEFDPPKPVVKTGYGGGGKASKMLLPLLMGLTASVLTNPVVDAYVPKHPRGKKDPSNPFNNK